MSGSVGSEYRAHNSVEHRFNVADTLGTWNAFCPSPGNFE
jgi:hypothetical protein